MDNQNRSKDVEKLAEGISNGIFDLDPTTFAEFVATVHEIKNE